MRATLPNRRQQVTEVVKLREREYIVTFGFAPDGRVVEAFCSSPKTGSDDASAVSDGCIALSLLLQHGMTMAELAETFGENRNEGERSGPPASVLGAIARAGAAIDAQN